MALLHLLENYIKSFKGIKKASTHHAVNQTFPLELGNGLPLGSASYLLHKVLTHHKLYIEIVRLAACFKYYIAIPALELNKMLGCP